MGLPDRPTPVTRLIDHNIVRDQGRWLQLKKGPSSDIRQRDTRSQLSAGAQVILQPMTVEQRELMITRLWCCRPAADVV